MAGVSTRGAEHGHRAGLGGAHHGADVVLGEHPLHGYEFGLVLVEPELQALLDPQQPVGDVQLRRGADDAAGDHAQRTPRRAVDHAHPAAGQTGVDTENAHSCCPSPRTDGCW
jgi:hypothetical protein